MKMKLYKLTDRDGYTRRGASNRTLWAVGTTHTATGTSGGLCSAEYIHAYEHALLGLFLNPIHADLKDLRLWEGEGEVEARDGQMKVGVKTLAITAELPVPAISTEQRVRFGIYCAWLGGSAEWRTWARGWLSGTDRSKAAAAEAARAAARAAAESAARAASVAAAVAAVRRQEHRPPEVPVAQATSSLHC